jgi:hypothetical protein
MPAIDQSPALSIPFLRRIDSIRQSQANPAAIHSSPGASQRLTISNRLPVLPGRAEPDWHGCNRSCEQRFRFDDIAIKAAACLPEAAFLSLPPLNRDFGEPLGRMHAEIPDGLVTHWLFDRFQDNGNVIRFSPGKDDHVNVIVGRRAGAESPIHEPKPHHQGDPECLVSLELNA